VARRPKGPELDAAETAELPLRRRAAAARDARARAEDEAHEETMGRYGRPYEQLFRSKRRPSPPSQGERGGS